jgi:hypothetical protein
MSLTSKMTEGGRAEARQGPANLGFQSQREMKEKFDAKFLVLKGLVDAMLLAVPR